MKQRLFAILIVIIALMLVSLCMTACEEEVPPEHVDVGTPANGGSIYTAAELISFFEKGQSGSAALGTSIDLGDDILKLEKDRGAITIQGNGFSITGNGDCVIRLGDGCTLRLEDVEIVGGRSGIGCLGDAVLGGEITISSIAHSITAVGDVTVEKDSVFNLSSNVGCGLRAKGLTILPNSTVATAGALGGINIMADDLVLSENTTVSAITDDNYNALKCEGTLILKDGATLVMINNGPYHGAELRDMEVEGVVNVEALGGGNGVGIFLFEQDEDVFLVGRCLPEPRFEVGDGSITFVEDASQIPVPEPEEDAETDEDVSLGDG